MRKLNTRRLKRYEYCNESYIWRPRRSLNVNLECYTTRYAATGFWAWYAQVKANNGASGVDQVTFDVIENEIGVSNFLRDIQSRLRAKRYKPQPVRRVFIPKAAGGVRPLGIPVIADRVVQAAVKIVIEPLFEASFKDFSYGFRPRKNAQQALREIYKWLNFKCHWVIDADLKSYFDTIPHDKLMLSVKTRVTDRSVLKLIEMWLKADVMGDSSQSEDEAGTPQGGLCSAEHKPPYEQCRIMHSACL